MTNSGPGYIIVPNWDKFQHYKDRRPAWVKLHLDLLGNDAWLELRGDDAKLLITIWMLIARYGNGRVPADKVWLQRQSKAGLSHVYRSSNDGLTTIERSSNGGLSNRYRGLERLIEAGFIQVVASKTIAPRYHDASPEVEGSKEPKNKNESAASSARRNGAAAAHKKELEVAIRTAAAWLPDDPRHLVEHTIHQTWPDLADEIIAGLPASTRVDL